MIRCDCCGRFMAPGSPGSSWVMVPHSDVSCGDERDRCAQCTSRHGPAQAASGFVKHLVQGVIPAESPAAATQRAVSEFYGPIEQEASE